MTQNLTCPFNLIPMKCLKCKESFKKGYSKHKPFCCAACKTAYGKKPIFKTVRQMQRSKPCQFCKELFYSKHSVQKFCNRACYKKSQQKPKLELCSKFALAHTKATTNNTSKILKDFESKQGFYRKHKEEYKDKIVEVVEKTYK